MKSIAAICLAATASACDWIWEDCSWMYYRDLCEDENFEGATDCGWVYWDDWSYEEFWVTCDEFAEWEWCWGDDEGEWECEYEWLWDECWGAEWLDDCGESDECGWWYWDDYNWESYWVSCEDWEYWCAW